MLPAVPAVKVAYMLNQTKPRELRPGSLQNPAGNSVFGLQVGSIRHYVLAPFQFEEYARCRTLLLAVAREKNLD